MLVAEGKRLHEAGDYATSMEVLGMAQGLLGIE